MSDAIFLASVARITAGDFALTDLIEAAGQLRDASQISSAEQLYKVWIKFNAAHPHLYAAWFNLSTVPGLAPATAIEALSHCLALKPDFWPGHINLGGCYERAGELDRAVGQWQTVLQGLELVTGAAAAHKLTAMKQISRVLIDHQRSETAEAYLQQCLEIDPRQRDALEQYFGLRLAQCRWPVIAPWDGADRKTLLEGISPLSLSAYTDDPMLQLASAARYVDATSGANPGTGASDRRDAVIDLASRRIRVGYLSSDLRDHAVGYLMAGVFEAHDPALVETFAYYCGPPLGGDLNERFKRGANHWREITDLGDDDAAALIAADELDILVDVNGHTRFARTAVFARRPAPIQVNWLGYPGTMGTAFHQYLISDEWIIPPDHELYYSEKVVRVPCYQPNDPNRAVAEDRPTRASVGLPEDAFVYCCFNGTQKIARFAFERWLQILARVPGSVLWLLESDEVTNQRLLDRAAGAGIDPQRLVFARKLPNAHHLARYPLADLFLDTAPYGAHTTGSDALWMGVPVLTWSGRGFASRVCGSLVRSAGLPDMICETAAEYVERAVAYASDPEAVAALKARLEAARGDCALFDLPRLVGAMEGLYRDMCEAHQQGRTPRPDLRNLETYLRTGVDHDPDASEMQSFDDYRGLWRQRLARVHRNRPIPPDARLWTLDDIAWFDPVAADRAASRTPVDQGAAVGNVVRVRAQSSARKRATGAATA
jgi:predicted O-linked N-acetylglucosamine transferase (SPINDLY family)